MTARYRASASVRAENAFEQSRKLLSRMHQVIQKVRS